MASQRNGTLHVGVTSDLVKRASQHKAATSDRFTSRHGCTLLVYYELHADMTAAITREKQLKAGSRVKKADVDRNRQPAVARPLPGDSLMTPLTYGILWNRLIAVVEEQAQTMIRTAFSTTVRESGDLSAGVFDLQGRMLAQAVTGTPARGPRHSLG